MRKLGFTLIEMLVVLAITAIMLGIIILPIMQSFNFTRSAQGFADAQEKGRQLIERIAREVANSAGVRDNSGLRGAVAVVVPGQNGAREAVLIENSKLDILLPAKGDPSNVRDGAYVNPDTGVADPTARAPMGQFVLPVAPGQTMKRYFIGLREPLATNNLDPALYNNPYDGILMNRGSGRDNLYVLYEAEFTPIEFRNGNFQVNQSLFMDADGDGRPDDLDDPYFFVQDPPNFPVATPQERQAKATRIQNWKRISRIVTEFSRYDMIQPIFDRGTRQPFYVGNVPRILGLVQFRPTAMSNEPASAAKALRLGEETDTMRGVAPDVFRTEYGNWSSAVVRLYPSNFDPSNTALNHYSVARLDSRAGDRRFKIFRYDPDLDADRDDRNGEGDPADDFELFDIDTYQTWQRFGRVYPFTRAALAAHSRSGWLTNAVARASFVPFVGDSQTGTVYTSFGIDEVGQDDPTGATPPRADNNLPFVETGPATTPQSEPNLGGNFWDYTTINQLFNKLWWDMNNPSSGIPDIRPNLHRFIDLRVAPNADGASSPLHPDPTVGFPQAQIVPGSEVVYGPDQNPGPNYGNEIRYTRTTRSPGPNQYRINYTDLREPQYAQLGLPNPPANYDPQNFMSAIYQPRFKVGYLQLFSDENVGLPGNSSGGGRIRVFYRFQFNGPINPGAPDAANKGGDTVTVDYDTRQLISILLTVRNYPQSTLPNPQSITLKATAPVRNTIR